MQYAKVNGETVLEFPSYPQRDNPNTSFGEGWTGGTVNGSTYVTVEIENTPPTDYLTQDTEALTPAKVNGKWIQKIRVKDISAAEKARRKAESAQRDLERLESYLTKDEIKAIRNLLKPQ
ncbi:MAG: hypothetical protein EBU46_21215 [Nitrosomonadaceae bacterium]|nr:hypothetical protein [Nitrosomonadaceae bacterium]